MIKKYFGYSKNLIVIANSITKTKIIPIKEFVKRNMYPGYLTNNNRNNDTCSKNRK